MASSWRPGHDELRMVSPNPGFVVDVGGARSLPASGTDRLSEIGTHQRFQNKQCGSFAHADQSQATATATRQRTRGLFSTWRSPNSVTTPRRSCRSAASQSRHRRAEARIRQTQFASRGERSTSDFLDDGAGRTSSRRRWIGRGADCIITLPGLVPELMAGPLGWGEAVLVAGTPRRGAGAKRSSSTGHRSPPWSSFSDREHRRQKRPFVGDDQGGRQPGRVMVTRLLRSARALHDRENFGGLAASREW